MRQGHSGVQNVETKIGKISNFKWFRHQKSGSVGWFRVSTRGLDEVLGTRGTLFLSTSLRVVLGVPIVARMSSVRAVRVQRVRVRVHLIRVFVRVRTRVRVRHIC